MRDLAIELKALRLHGMAAAWAELLSQGEAQLDASRWLIEHLLAAEATDRGVRSVAHQMHAAKFPAHRDLAGFDFDDSPVDRKLVCQLAEMSFTDDAHNAVLVGGTGTGKTHLATAIGVDLLPASRTGVKFVESVFRENGGHEEEQIQRRTGHRVPEAGRGRDAGQGTVQEGRVQRRHVLQVARPFRRHGRAGCAAAAGAGAGERQAQAAAG